MLLEATKPRTRFEDAAGPYLPGFLYRFNIADFKRRNCHLSHQVGDADIAELDRRLKALAPDRSLVQRIKGDVWLLLSRENELLLVVNLIANYRRSEKMETGWRIEATRGDEKAKTERVVASSINRAVRCLSAEVRDPAELSRVLKALEANDYSLPVDRVIPLETVAGLAREPWMSVPRYPAENPDCPFCHGRDFDWKDGDMSVYSGWGDCKTCGADVLITQIS